MQSPVSKGVKVEAQVVATQQRACLLGEVVQHLGLVDCCPRTGVHTDSQGVVRVADVHEEEVPGGKKREQDFT